MRTEAYQALVELAAVTATGAYSVWPVDAGAYPTITNGRAEYGCPVPRVTWRRSLPVEVTPGQAQISLPCYRRGAPAQVRG